MTSSTDKPSFGLYDDGTVIIVMGHVPAAKMPAYMRVGTDDSIVVAHGEGWVELDKGQRHQIEIQKDLLLAGFKYDPEITKILVRIYKGYASVV